MKRPLARIALRVAAVYAAVAGLWILLSDKALRALVADPDLIAKLEIAKGWFFVLITAGLLYLVLRRELWRAEMEAERRAAAEAALRESEARFRLMVETINEVFWIRDPSQTEILYVSPGFERIWGRRVEELHANPALWLDAIVPEDRERIRVASNTRETTGEYDEEFRIKRPDGEVRWIHARAFPVKNAGGRVTRIVGVSLDITARKRLEAQFLRAQRLESVGTLAGGVAHDLNNILSPILMASSLLKQEPRDADTVKLAGMMESAAQRGAAIIRQLLTFSRGVEGKRVPLQVRLLLAETVEMVRATFPRSIVISLAAPSDLWPVVGDATLLHQIFMNLCVNARDAMPSGGSLSISAENLHFGAVEAVAHVDARPGPYILVTVSDTGEGIAPENLEHIFDPFFTTKGPGKGTGLGLSTVLGIVKGHEGFITVESKPGIGTSFKVHLPARTVDDPVEGLEGCSPEVPGHGETILLVDDEEPILEASRRVLEAANYKVVSAHDGREALDLLGGHREQVRLIVTDVMMPVMDGLALIRAVRSFNSTMPIIVTSGLHDADKSAELAALGVATIVAKPCPAHELQNAVAAELRRANGRDPAAAES